MGESSKQHRKQNVVYAAHRKEKKKVASIRVKIYFVGAKKCQGTSELEVFNIRDALQSPFRLVMKMHLHQRNRKRMNAWLRAKLDLNKTIF